MSKTSESRKQIGDHLAAAWGVLSKCELAIPGAEVLNKSLREIHRIAGDPELWSLSDDDDGDGDVDMTEAEGGILDWIMGGESASEDDDSGDSPLLED